MSTFNEELYLEMVQNEEAEAPCYYDEENCYAPVFDEIINNYE